MKKTLIALTALTLSASAHAQFTTPKTFTAGTAIKAADMNSNFSAIQTELRRLDGRIVAFTHMATTSNYITCFDNAATNNNPNAFVVITRVWGSGGSNAYITTPISIYYASNKWCAYSENATTSLNNVKFNVLVIK